MPIIVPTILLLILLISAHFQHCYYHNKGIGFSVKITAGVAERKGKPLHAQTSQPSFSKSSIIFVVSIFIFSVKHFGSVTGLIVMLFFQPRNLLNLVTRYSLEPTITKLTTYLRLTHIERENSNFIIRSISLLCPLLIMFFQVVCNYLLNFNYLFVSILLFSATVNRKPQSSRVLFSLCTSVFQASLLIPENESPGTYSYRFYCKVIMHEECKLCAIFLFVFL